MINFKFYFYYFSTKARTYRQLVKLQQLVMKNQCRFLCILAEVSGLHLAKKAIVSELNEHHTLYGYWLEVVADRPEYSSWYDKDYLAFRNQWLQMLIKKYETN